MVAARTSRLVVGLVLFACTLVVLTLSSYDADRPWVNVRWEAGIDEAERTEAERLLALADGRRALDDARTWSYRLLEYSDEKLRAIVEHPSVEDTSGLDRRRFALQRPPEGIVTHAARSTAPSGAATLLLVSLFLFRPRRGPDDPAAEHRLARVWRWCAVAYVCAVLAGLTVLLQFATHPTITNDYAGYLAMARQIVLGEWPIRDFLDHGTFLQVLLSAALQWTFGHHLLADMVVSTACMALGYGVTFILASSLVRSYAVGFLLAVSCVLTTPRPYSYPKVFIYPLAVGVLWMYVRRPSTLRLAALGVMSAVALMIRIDHGVVLLCSATAIIVLRHLPDGSNAIVRAVGNLLVWFIVGLAPFAVYVAVTAGLAQHVAAIGEFGGRALAQSDPLRLHLPFLQADATSLQRAVALIHDSYMLVTVAALAVVSWRLYREIKTAGRLTDVTLRLAAGAAVWCIAAPVLVRDAFHARFPDVAPVVAILGAGLVAAAFGAGDRSTRPETSETTRVRMRRVAPPLVGVAVVCLLLIPSVMLHGGFGGVSMTVRSAWRGLVPTGRVYAEAPPRQVLDGNARQIVRYARACTEPTDRILVTWFAPQIYFGSNRRFAGNQWVYINYRNSAQQQEEVLRLMGGQAVPLVVARENDPMFAGFWPLLAAYVEREYRQVGSLGGMTIYADRGRAPTGADTVTGLPCFAEPESTGR